MFIYVRVGDIAKEEDLDVRPNRYLKSGNNQNVLRYLKMVKEKVENEGEHIGFCRWYY